MEEPLVYVKIRRHAQEEEDRQALESGMDVQQETRPVEDHLH